MFLHAKSNQLLDGILHTELLAQFFSYLKEWSLQLAAQIHLGRSAESINEYDQ